MCRKSQERMTTEVADQQFENRVVDMGELQQAHAAELHKADELKQANLIIYTNRVRQDELAVKKEATSGGGTQDLDETPPSVIIEEYGEADKPDPAHRIQEM